MKNTISRVLVGSIRFSKAKYLGEWLAVVSTLKHYPLTTWKKELSGSEQAVLFRILSCFLALLIPSVYLSIACLPLSQNPRIRTVGRTLPPASSLVMRVST